MESLKSNLDISNKMGELFSVKSDYVFICYKGSKANVMGVMTNCVCWIIVFLQNTYRQLSLVSFDGKNNVDIANIMNDYDSNHKSAKSIIL